MPDAFCGAIRIFAGAHAPKGWMFCQGQSLPTNGNQHLFSLLGTTYGGDGTNNFNLPDLRGRIAVGMGLAKTGTTYALGATGGQEAVHMDPESVPSHTHQLYASDMAADTLSPVNASYAQTAVHVLLYPDSAKPTAPDRYFSRDTIGPSGGSPRPEPHPNMMPSLGVNFIICINGIFPSFPQ